MWGWFGGGAAAKKNAPKNAIISLREQLEMLSKRERHLEQQVAEQDAVARKNVSTNKQSEGLIVRLDFGSSLFIPYLFFSDFPSYISPNITKINRAGLTIV